MKSSDPFLTRRVFLSAIAASAFVPRTFAGPAESIGLLLPGRRDDGGFMEAGFKGFQRGVAAAGANSVILDGVAPKPDVIAAAIRKMANDGVRLIVAHGGQCDEAVRTVAMEFPNARFAVIQGAVTRSNCASYEVLQEESAWLAGAYAALTTRTGVVGHISGIRVPPGLKGRAGYAAGVAAANPEVKLLTTFCGEQDDAALAKKVTLAQAAAGADIIFTMLNAGRTGAIEGCREAKISQIGNVKDWRPVAPDVFVASAIADVSIAMETAVTDLLAGKKAGGEHVKIGLAQGSAVSLAMSPDTNADVRQAIDTFKGKIVSGEIKVPTKYNGEEFSL